MLWSRWCWISARKSSGQGTPFTFIFVKYLKVLGRAWIHHRFRLKCIRAAESGSRGMESAGKSFVQHFNTCSTLPAKRDALCDASSICQRRTHIRHLHGRTPEVFNWWLFDFTTAVDVAQREREFFLIEVRAHNQQIFYQKTPDASIR
jgi:hypothetical protein